MRNEAWIWGRVMMGSRIPGPRGVTNRGPTTWLIGKKVLWGRPRDPSPGAAPVLGIPGEGRVPAGTALRRVGLRRFFPDGDPAGGPDPGDSWAPGTPGSSGLGRDLSLSRDLCRRPTTPGDSRAGRTLAGMDLESPIFFEASRFPKKENVVCR